MTTRLVHLALSSYFLAFNNIGLFVFSKFLKRHSKAKRTTAPAYSRALRRIKGGFKRGVKRSSGPNSRVPGGDRVAVRVGVVEMGGMIRRVRVRVIEEMRF